MTPSPSYPARARAWPTGAVVFALALAAAFLGYAIAIYSQARGTTDWMMVLPAAGIGVLALLVSIFEDIRMAGVEDPATGAEKAEGAGQTIRTILFMALLCLYIAAIPYAGFDISSFVFLATALIVQGERRPWVCVGFAAVVAAPVVWLFVEVLRVPLPTALL